LFSDNSVYFVIQNDELKKQSHTYLSDLLSKKFALGRTYYLTL